jgi:hypothetical protein
MYRKLALGLVLPMVLAACGGGSGGGGAGSSATLAPFVKFSSIAVPGSVRINGSSQEATYTFNTGTQRVTSVSGATPFASGATYDATYNANGGFPTKVVFNSATGTNITIDTALGDTFGRLAAFPNVEFGVTADEQSLVLASSAAAYGWDYQAFGVWDTSGGTGSGTVGAVTVGAETAGAAIPLSGTGSFVGVSGGQYVNSSGEPFYTGSDMTATANFGARSIAFATSNTATSTDLTSATANANLNMAGTLSYSAGVNQFTGSVTSVGGGPSNAAMSGTAAGKFYGPTAQEIGGTFGLSNGSTGYLGAFGGKR